jgi:uncharacterized protein (TIGR00290 family)
MPELSGWGIRSRGELDQAIQVREEKVLREDDISNLGDKAFVSWSGGKDSCFACYLAIKSGLDVRYLASMLTKNTGRLFPHYLTAEVLRAQAEAIGIPLYEKWLEVPENITQLTPFIDYDIKYSEMLRELKALGVTGGVFGDVSVGNQWAQQHYDRIENLCRPVGIKPYRPLWDLDREKMIRDFIDLGFKPLIIAADNRLSDLLGGILDHKVLDEIKGRHTNFPGQSQMIYHTFVIDGPLFKHRVEIVKSDKVMAGGSSGSRPRNSFIGGVSYLDIQAVKLLP